jgi:hypothetical protein
MDEKVGLFWWTKLCGLDKQQATSNKHEKFSDFLDSTTKLGCKHKE